MADTRIEIIRRKITLQDLLVLPLIPLILDTFARILFLYDKLEWYVIPDLVMVLVTFAFFNLGLMNAVKRNLIPADEEVNLNIELVKRELLTVAILATMAAGGLSFYKAMDDAFPDKAIAEKHGLAVFAVISVFVIYNLLAIKIKFIKYVGG
jgi:hypothetical protein